MAVAMLQTMFTALLFAAFGITETTGLKHRNVSLDNIFVKPKLQLSFAVTLNSSFGQLRLLTADASRFAISIRYLPENSLEAVDSLCDLPAHDGAVTDLANGKQFSLQRFFKETVCYETDMDPAFWTPAVHGKGDNGTERLQAQRMMVFTASLGQAVGAPLDLYNASKVITSHHKVAGRFCTIWGANRTYRTPLGHFLQEPASMRATGWTAPPLATLMQVRKDIRRNGTKRAQKEMVLSEHASFCVTPAGELLATSSTRRMSLEGNGLSYDMWQAQESSTAASFSAPKPEAFDAACGAASARCVDLTQGSTGPSELAASLNAEERLNRINEEAGHVWKAAPYSLWEGMTVGQSRSSLGTEIRALRLPLRTGAAGEVLSSQAGRDSAVPVSFDARARWPKCLSIGIIRNQGTCGSCWAFSAAAVLSDRFCVAASVEKGNASALLQSSAQVSTFSLAPEHLVDCDRKNNGCSGGRLDDAWQYLQEKGVPPEACRPYRFCPVPSVPNCHYGHRGRAASLSVGREHGQQGKCGSACAGGEPMRLFRAGQAYAVALPGNVEGIQRELLNNGPVQVAFFVFSDFHNYRRGVYFRTKGAYGPLGGHAVRFIGWGFDEAAGEKYWLGANSWSPMWGMAGLFRIRRGTNECGIESTPAAGLPDLSEPQGRAFEL